MFDYFFLSTDERPVSFDIRNNNISFLKILDKIINFILSHYLLSPHFIYIKSWHTQEKCYSLFSDVTISMTNKEIKMLYNTFIINSVW